MIPHHLVDTLRWYPANDLIIIFWPQLALYLFLSNVLPNVACKVQSQDTCSVLGVTGGM